MQQWKQRRAEPGPQVPRILVGGIVVDGQPARIRVVRELAARERQERPHQSTARSGTHARESRGRAAMQRAQQDRLHLVVLVMRGDEILRAAPILQVVQPGVSHTARFCFRCVRAEMQFGITRRERGDRPSDRPAVRRNAVVYMDHRERDAELAGHAVQEIEQRDRIRATRYSDQRLSRCAEESGFANVGQHARRQRVISGHVS